jgi:hypothetical protein
MKSERDDKNDAKTRQEHRRDSQDNNEQESDRIDKRPKLDTSLDLKDLGAGYEAEDRRVARAINIYETKLLPYIEQNQSIFKKSNFLALRGYAVGVSSIDKTASDH